MRTIRRAAARGHFDHGWLNTFHTFSFGEYHDPNQMGYRSLRVINDDVIAPGMGLGTHGHRDMEIITYVLEGSLRHEDNMGHGETLTPGEVQYMSAGTGIRHSEFNPSADERTHLYQIWFLPDRSGHTPRYAQKRFDDESTCNKLGLVVSPDGRDGSIAIYQDAELWLGRLDPGSRVHVEATPRRAMWVQVARGTGMASDIPLVQGDGLILEDESLEFVAESASELLVFKLS